VNSLSRFFIYWRTVVVRDREIVDAVVHPDHRGPSPELRVALEAWPGPRYWADDDGEGHLVLIRVLSKPRGERWWLHAGLFLVTFGTVWMGGALITGSPLSIPFARDLFLLGPSLLGWFQDLRPGLGFAIALMGILLAHEAGHYVLARRYDIDTSPPYFLPFPPMINIIGTLGAFIRLRSPIADRRQLLDIGAAGPWAGFVVALVVLVVGLLQAEVAPEASGPTPQYIVASGLHIYLGDSPVMHVLRRLLVGEGTVALGTVAFAGWIGLFVTMLNLLPMGQLDGGHVLYALMGDRQRRVAPVLFVGVLLLATVWRFWLFWAILILILGRGRLAHPSVLDRHRPLPRRRRWFGWATLLLFVATFTPAPFQW
jgi:Zn-dependent protease